MKKFTLGIDVGGTNIKLGLVNTSGKVVVQKSFSTKAYRHNKNKLLEALLRAVRSLFAEEGLKKENIQGIGIGLPGLIDPVRGMVNILPNISGWRKVPLKKIIEARLGIKTFLENDVNLITLGEWKYGAGRGVKNLVCITLGTGVGGGLIINNQLYRGEGFAAGEVGHMPLNEKGPACGCGGYGCFERYVGNRYVLKEAAKIFNKPNIDFSDIRRFSEHGNPKALLFWKDMATHIGNGLAGIVNLLNPTMIIIGGGISNNHKYLFPTIRQVIKRRAFKVPASMAKIVRTRLGDAAGIIGAQVLVNYEI